MDMRHATPLRLPPIPPTPKTFTVRDSNVVVVYYGSGSMTFAMVFVMERKLSAHKRRPHHLQLA